MSSPAGPSAPAPQAPQGPQGNWLDRAKTLVKRVPWWGWILIALAVYVGYRMLTGGTRDPNELPGDLSAGTPGAGVTDSAGQPGLPANLPTNFPTLPGLPSFPSFTPTTPGEIQEDTTDATDEGGGDLHDLTAEIVRQRQQGADLRQYWAEQDAKAKAAASAQALRSRQQGADIRAYNERSVYLQSIAGAVPEETSIARSIQTKPTYTPPPRRPANQAYTVTQTPTNRGVNVDYGYGNGPDSATFNGSYYMRRGETLSEIAERHGVATEDLYAANRDRLTVYQREAGWMGLSPLELPNLEGLVLAIPH